MITRTRQVVAKIPFLTQLPLLIALVALWLVLWGHIDVISVGTGIVFSLLVVRIFSLPPVELTGRFHLGWTIVFLLRFLWWVITASIEVAWVIVRPQKTPQSSIIAVRMRTRSDWLLTVAAIVNMLVPGTVVVDTDRLRNVLYLHVLDADTDEEIAAARKDAADIEEALALALGSRDDLARLNSARRAAGRRPLDNSRAQRAFEAKLEEARRLEEPVWEENS